MATFTSRGNTFNTTAGNKTVTATPAVGDFIIVVCANTGRTAAQPPTVTDNNSGGAGAYQLLTLTPTKATNVDSMWIFIRTALILSATSTIFTMTQTGDSGGGLEVLSLSGMSIVGAGAVRGGGEQDNQAGATTPAPILLRRVGTAFSGTQAALTTNACFSAVFNATNPAGTTQPASWTASVNGGYITPTTGLRTAFRNSGETASTITWGGTSASAFCSVVVELDASVPQYDYVMPGKADKERMIYRQGAVGRSSVW
jgi:hypothetical protein